MKRIIIIMTAIATLLTTTACSGGTVTVKDDSFVYNPQEIIDAINTAVKKDESAEYFTCDDFEASGESIHTSDDWSRIILTFDTNDDGLITKCRLYWSSEDMNANVISSAGLYTGVIVNTLTPDKSEDIFESITNIIVAENGSIHEISNGAVIEFETIDGKNWLDISIEDQ